MTSEDPGIRFPPPLIFLGLGLLGWTIERVSGIASLPLPNWVAWSAAAMLGILGVALVAAALLKFRDAGTPPEPWKPTSAITRKGIYGHTRNPMYLGMACVLLAAAVGLRSLGILATVPIALVIIDRFVVRREESYLLRRVGDTYADYLAHVRRWL